MIAPPSIHPTAIVHGEARLDEGVVVGPYAIVGAGVSLGARCVLMAHAIVDGPVEAGSDNVFYPFCAVGAPAQDRRLLPGEPSPLVLGSHNVIREHVTLHGGTGGRATRIGSGNLLMVGSHVAHDARVGDGCTLANGVQLAGHVVLEDGVTCGGLAAVAQFVRIGEGAFLAGGAMVEADVPPFVIAQGDRARVRALNAVGLRRRGVPEESIAALRATFRRLYKSSLSRGEALARVPRGDPYVERFLAFFEGDRGPL